MFQTSSSDSSVSLRSSLETSAFEDSDNNECADVGYSVVIEGEDILAGDGAEPASDAPVMLARFVLGSKCVLL